MDSQWTDEGARQAVQQWGAGPGCNEDVALRVYSSRLIGARTDLVLHGGGNTSVKTQLPDELGEPVDVLCVKGSGWDLGDIEPPGFPAVRLGSLQALRGLPELSDEAMVNAARTRLLDASSPNPSVEVLLHAFLPHKFIDHSHADAILAIVDQPEAESLCREVFGEALAIVPYVMPGFALSKLAAEVYERNPGVEGLALLQHGLFTFGDSARESYERHIDAVSKAEAFIASRRAHPERGAPVPSRNDFLTIGPALRGQLGEGKRRYILEVRDGEDARAFVGQPRVAERSSRGPATPDHVIRTKRVPIVIDPPSNVASNVDLRKYLDGALEDYREAYRAYVSEQILDKEVTKTPLDPDPRIILIPGVGIVAAGADRKAARIAADIYEHTIGIIDGADTVGTYQALPLSDIFDMEYWSLEQAKLGKRKRKPLQGQVVYVTGAGSGIGAETARRFSAAGAEVFVVDVDADGVSQVAAELKCPHEVVDVSDRGAVEASIESAVACFGGIDGVVSNAGTAPQAPIDACPPELFESSLAVNLFSHQWVAAAAARILRAQGTGGFLLFNASKAAFNPGPGFGPYAIAKAGVVALMKQYALELGECGVRANAINADRIRTGLLPTEVVEARARARGLEADAYFRSNLLRREVTAADVADAFLSLALAPSTTGAILTVDGGNIAASPR